MLVVWLACVRSQSKLCLHKSAPATGRVPSLSGGPGNQRTTEYLSSPFVHVISLPLCSALSRRAMGGSMPFQDALKARLDLMTPSKDTVARCLREHPPRLSPGERILVLSPHSCCPCCFLVLPVVVDRWESKRRDVETVAHHQELPPPPVCGLDSFMMS